MIDGKVTLMGSMNWSSGAALNSENLNLVHFPEGRRNLREPLAAAPDSVGAPRRAGRLVPGAHRRKSPLNRFGRLLWRVLDALDYLVMDARLRIVDVVCGPEPETAADRQRARDRERLERALQLSSGGKSQPM